MLQKINSSLAGAINKYHLNVSEKHPWYFLENDKCRASILKDYIGFELSISNKEELESQYSPFVIIDILAGETERYNALSKSISIRKSNRKEIGIEYLSFLNDLLVKYMSAPFEGDFSWSKEYFKREKMLLDLRTFVFSTPGTDMIKEKIAHHDLTWEADAQELIAKLEGRNNT